MKILSKMLLYVSICALVLSACDTTEPDKPDPSDMAAQFLSFGFYAEDNPGVLTEDYI